MEEKRKGNEVWADHRNLRAMSPARSCTNLIHSLHGMHNDANRTRTDAHGIFKLLSGNCGRLFFLDVAWVNTRAGRGRILMGPQTNTFGTWLRVRRTRYITGVSFNLTFSFTNKIGKLLRPSKIWSNKIFASIHKTTLLSTWLKSAERASNPRINICRPCCGLQRRRKTEGGGKIRTTGKYLMYLNA